MPEWKKSFISPDWEPGKVAMGGFYYRTMGIGRKIKELEEKGYQIVGIRLTEDNEGEFIMIPPGGEIPEDGIKVECI